MPRKSPSNDLPPLELGFQAKPEFKPDEAGNASAGESKEPVTEGKVRSPRNQTLTLNDAERARMHQRLVEVSAPMSLEAVINRTILGNCVEVASMLPKGCVDLLFLDPPYNLTRQYSESKFRELSNADYLELMDQWIQAFLPLLKPTATIYICGDWRSSGAIQAVASRYLKVQNRITWEREKGRGSLHNWKNCSEDIWYCTVGKEYYFNAEAVKLKRRVIAPYRDSEGKPKDWEKSGDANYRLTSPSNLWTDLTVPFWSMPENTDHPTQKPEKLMAKLILASSRPGELVMDPFLGSGTCSVVAKKLGRSYMGIEQEALYAELAEKRLELAEKDTAIQGYHDQVFWERNSTPLVS